MTIIDKEKIYKYYPNGTTTKVTFNKDAHLDDTSCGVIGRTVYCVGGYKRSMNTFTYDIDTDAVYGWGIRNGIIFIIDNWQASAPLNIARAWPSNGQIAVVDNRWLLVCGGNRGSNNSCEVLDTKETPLKWKPITNIPSSMCNGRFVTVGVEGSWAVVADGTQ